MKLRGPSSESLTATALEEAEQMLIDLPYTPTVRAMHSHLIALKSVLQGHLRASPRLTEEQLAKLSGDALALSAEVAAAGGRLRG